MPACGLVNRFAPRFLGPSGFANAGRCKSVLGCNSSWKYSAFNSDPVSISNCSGKEKKGEEKRRNGELERLLERCGVDEKYWHQWKRKIKKRPRAIAEKYTKKLTHFFLDMQAKVADFFQK